MGKPQMDGRESGCRKNASSGWRAECRSARTRGAVARQTPVEGEAGWASPRWMAGRAAARTPPRAAGAGSAGRLGQEGLWPGRLPSRGSPDGQAPDGWQGERLPEQRLERLAQEVPVGSDKRGYHFAYPWERLGYLFENIRKEERREAHSFAVITLRIMRKSAGGQNGRHNAA